MYEVAFCLYVFVMISKNLVRPRVQVSVFWVLDTPSRALPVHSIFATRVFLKCSKVFIIFSSYQITQTHTHFHNPLLQSQAHEACAL